MMVGKPDIHILNREALCFFSHIQKSTQNGLIRTVELLEEIIGETLQYIALAAIFFFRK